MCLLVIVFATQCLGELIGVEGRARMDLRPGKERVLGRVGLGQVVLKLSWEFGGVVEAWRS
jgi:hypothetical protein